MEYWWVIGLKETSPGADKTWDAKFPLAGCQWQMNAYRDPPVEIAMQ